MSASKQSNAPQPLAGVGFKFPEALLSRPRCLIALSGLDTVNNAVHRLVWEEFTKHHASKKPILYKNFPADHLYPKNTENRATYDDYSPVGVLKTSWLVKHTEELPALVGFFFDLDWEDPQWDERQTECVSKIEVIRSALENRATEIVVVLLQSSPPLPAGDTSSSHSERAAALCAACELPKQNLFVLPFTQRPQGFILRIEEAFYNKAVGYYVNQVRAVQAHKEMVTPKQSMQLVSIRHHFKMAFFSEMKQDPIAALRLYNAAYTHLLETMYLNENRIMEFKLMAGFINYKICRLMFEANDPRSSIAQFRKHIDRFTKEQGPSQLIFEHSEWLSRQFSAFADLFSVATRHGLQGIQTQNPGIYYHNAALYAIERRNQANTLCLEAAKAITLEQAASELAPGSGNVYYGQRPWRHGLSDDKPSNMVQRQRCIQALQAQEYRVQHSWQIIPLLAKAIAQYENHQSVRMITHLKVLLAQEYYLVKEWDKTFMLLEGVCEMYRKEQWWNPLTSVQQLALRCTYLTGQLEAYLSTALELTGNYLLLPHDEKRRIQGNVLKILQGESPSPETGVDNEAVGGATYKWTTLLSSGDEARKVKVQASSLASCIDCKTVFSQSEYTADSVVEVKVHLRSTAPSPLQLSRLQVEFVQEEYNSWCVPTEQFQLEPLTIHTSTFSFPANQHSVGAKIEVKTVRAVCGAVSSEGGEGCECVLLWNEGLSRVFTSKPLGISWQKLTSRCSTCITPCPASVEISLSHNPPVLTGEYYPIKLSINNQETRKGRGPMTDIQVSIFLPDNMEDTQPSAELYSCLPDSGQSTDFVAKQPQVGQSLEVSCDQLGQGETLEETFYLCTRDEGLRGLLVSVSCSVACQVREEWDLVVCICQKEHSVNIQSVRPFDIRYKLMSTSFQEIGSVVYEQPFVIMTEVQCTSKSPWHVSIIDSQFEQVKEETLVTQLGSSVSQIKGLSLGPSDKATECHCLTAATPPNGEDSTIALGTYIIKWRRTTDTSSIDLTDKITFPSVSAKPHPYSVSADIPASGLLREVLLVSYTVHNKTDLIQEFEVKMGANELFMYSGNRLVRFRILPKSDYTVTFNLFPVATGLVSLPTLDLQHQREGEGRGAAPVINTLPSSIFIKPAPLVRTDSTAASKIL